MLKIIFKENTEGCNLSNTDSIRNISHKKFLCYEVNNNNSKIIKKLIFINTNNLLLNENNNKYKYGKRIRKLYNKIYF